MKNKAAFFVGVLTGSIVGSVTALLFAPKSGKEMRSDIKEGAERVVEATSKAVDRVTESMYDVGKQIEDRTAVFVSSAKQGVHQFVDGVKQLRNSEDVQVVEETINDEELITIDHEQN